MTNNTTLSEAEQQVKPQPEPVDNPAWELIEAGRYMPRRIRGSFRGRELG